MSNEQAGDRDVSEILAEAGLDMDAIDEEAKQAGQEFEKLPKDQQALFRAITAEDTKEVNRLISKGADLNKYRCAGASALACAIERNNDEIAKILITKGADVNADGPHGSTPLMLAARNGSKAIVTALLKAGAMLDARDKDGNTAGEQAAIMGHDEIAAILDA